MNFQYSCALTQLLTFQNELELTTASLAMLQLNLWDPGCRDIRDFFRAATATSVNLHVGNSKRF